MRVVVAVVGAATLVLALSTCFGRLSPRAGVEGRSSPVTHRPWKLAFLFFDRNVFANWYYTPGCSPCRGSRNKHMYVTDQKVGFEEGACR